jgi:tetratricopeptide (TPR) repeat protein
MAVIKRRNFNLTQKMESLNELQGIDHLERHFGIDFRTIARDMCFLASSVGTTKRHRPTPHVYSSDRLADRRVGWIYQQAYALALSGKYVESLARFDEVLRLEPAYFHAWNQKGLCNYFLQRYNEAIKCFDKTTSLNLRYYESHNNKGCALQRLDQFGAAIDCFDEVESLHDGLFETYNNKALSLIALGDFTGALTCVDRCVQTGVIKASFYVLRSLCYLALDQTSEGLRDVEIALKFDPSNSHAFALRAVLHRATTA